MIRDCALSAAGLLVDRVGGLPVKPYQPDGVWEEATFGNKKYRRDAGESLYRRSLYVFWRRIIGPTEFFDVANRQTCSVRTRRTNTPLQALLLLNDTTYVESARMLAARVLAAEPLLPGRRANLAFHLILGREPTEAEMRVVLLAVDRHIVRFARDPDAAASLLSNGDAQNPSGSDPVAQAAWTLVCSTLMNLDEALSKE